MFKQSNNGMVKKVMENTPMGRRRFGGPRSRWAGGYQKIEGLLIDRRLLETGKYICNK